MNKIIKQSLTKICTFLSNKKINLLNESADGRINSSINENLIISGIEECLNSDAFFKNNEINLIKVKRPRYWFDVAFEQNGVLFPINIKITNLSNNTADNISSKEGMAYALTGILPEELPMNTWDRFNKTIFENIDCSSETDYYFIIVNKADTSDIFFNSLKHIKELIPNGNNLPFQCKWANNRQLEDRTNIDSIKYILNIYNLSNQKKEEAARKSVMTITNILKELNDI